MRDGEQALGGGAEENAVDWALVVVGDVRNLLRHGEDHVKVFDRQQLGLTAFQPAGARSVFWHFGQCRLRHEL